MMDIKEVFFLWFINFLIKSPLHLQINRLKVVVLLRYKMRNQLKIYTNQLLKNLKKRRVYSSFKDNILGADSAGMELISKFNKETRFLLCVIDIFNKYVWGVPLKDRKGVTIVNAFQKILDNSTRKPNKIWVDKGSEFYNSFLKKWLKDNDIKIYSTYNAGKLVVAEDLLEL